jgi:putative peptide zinc metalloprotease protein
MALEGPPSSEFARAPRPGGTSVIVPERPPVLADGIELIGAYEGSGYREPPSLVRRADGQVIQLPDLLYKVAAKADGTRTYDEIADEVSREIRRGLDGSSVKFLAEEKLRPLGVLAAADGTSPPLEKADPFLGFKVRAGVIPEAVSNTIGTLFRPLFFPPVILAVLAAFVATDVWLFGTHGIAQSLRQTMYTPALFLPIFAAIVLSAAFHETGHAAGCRYGGGRPGKMGCGLYLAWPAFYTDVTDAYRLGRGARLRTDLGGVYFNVIVVLATVAAYAATGFEPLLLLAVIQHFEIAHQLLPIVRLDGYYIVADATGVPDLFARIGPILRSAVPGRKPDEQVKMLKPWVRRAVTGWVLVVVPLLGFQLFIILLHLPRILGTAGDSAHKAWGTAQAGFRAGNTLGGIGSILQLIVLAIPTIGIVLIVVRALKGSAGWVWRKTDGKPVRRMLSFTVAGVLGVALLFSWISPHNYQPIRPGERGTVIEGVRAVRDVSDLPRQSAPRPEPATTTTTLDTSESTTTSVTPTTVRRRTSDEPAVTSTTVGSTTTEPEETTTTTRARTTTTVGG